MTSVLIDLFHGKGKTRIDESDLRLVDGRRLHLYANGYVHISASLTLHAFLINAPKGTQIDHINGDKLDNRRSNLRVVSHSLNQVNRKKLGKRNTSGVRGVSRASNRSDRKPWVAQIGVSGKTIFLGRFGTKDEAIEARRAAELKYFGEYCPTNAPAVEASAYHGAAA